MDDVKVDIQLYDLLDVKLDDVRWCYYTNRLCWMMVGGQEFVFGTNRSYIIFYQTINKELVISYEWFNVIVNVSN